MDNIKEENRKGPNYLLIFMVILGIIMFFIISTLILMSIVKKNNKVTDVIVKRYPNPMYPKNTQTYNSTYYSECGDYRLAVNGIYSA